MKKVQFDSEGSQASKPANQQLEGNPRNRDPAKDHFAQRNSTDEDKQ